MISKLSKIFASAAIFSALVFTSSVSFADGMEPCHKPKVKPCHTVVHQEPCHTPAPCPEPYNEPMKTGGLTAGMTAGISGDWGFAINENNDAVFGSIAPVVGTATVEALPGFSLTPFNAKHDYAYGGNISWGYMMNNGLEANVELGYHQIKNKTTLHTGSFIKSDIMSGLVNGTYYADFNSMVLPYVSIGVGIARTKANGVIADHNSALSTVTGFNTASTTAPYDTATFVATDLGNGDLLTFNDLKAIRLAYQAGVGISAMFDSALVGIGYKFFGVNDIDSNDSDFNDFTGSVTGFTATGTAAPTTATAISTTSSTTALVNVLGNATAPNFGSIRNQIHNVTVFAKFVV